MPQRLFYLSLVISFILPLYLHGQVTIGTREKPAEGALLQLKNIENVTDGTANANKGLIIPRVKLESSNSLKGISTESNEDPLTYAGLVVFNSNKIDNECALLPQGMYVWDGSSWELLSGGAGQGVEDRTKGSYLEDLKALQKIKDENPGAEIYWSVNVAEGTYSGNGITFKEVCGEKRLVSLNAYGDKLKTIDLRALTALDYLYISKSSIETIDLSHNTKLRELILEMTNLKELNVSKLQELQDLRCGGNTKLTAIDLSKNPKLKKFSSIASNNSSFVGTKFIALDFSNNPLIESINCYKNDALTSINLTGATKLTYLDAYEIKTLKALDLKDNIALTYLNCSNTSISKLDLSKNTALKTLLVNGSPIEHSVSLLANTALTTLNISSTPIEELILSENKELVTLTASSTKISSLNLNTNSKLVKVDAPHNEKLGTVLLTGAVSLKELDLSYSGIKPSIDFSKNLQLEKLIINNNQLTALNVDYNTALKELNCNTNQIRDLNVDNNIKLEKLTCYRNDIQSLKVDKNLALTYLYCSQNPSLKNLDVRQNIGLTSLFCDNIGLTTTIDLSKNINLATLSISSNKITSLDLSKNVKLTGLSASDIMTPIDLSHNTELTNYTCANNEYTDSDINVTANKKLTELNCSNNKIKTLDLSENKLLREVKCYGGVLEKVIFASEVPNMYSLDLRSNQLKSLDISMRSNLQYLYLNDNPMVDIPKSITICRKRLENWSSSGALVPGKTSPAYNAVECSYY